MLGITRKKRKEEEDVEEEKEEVKPKPKRKPRKNKEKKPWGKKERIIVASVISFTILSSFLLLVFSNSWQRPNFAISPPNLNLSNSKPIVLGKSDSKYATKDEMKKTLAERLLGSSGTFGIEIIELNSGKNYGVNQNEKFEGTSHLKLPLIIILYIEKEKGHIDLSGNHILQEDEKRGGSGVLVSLPDGTAISYKDLISYMAKEGDNTAFNILGNKIGWSRIDEIARGAGLLNTSFKSGITTPYDTGILLQKFINGQLVSESSKNEILDLLASTEKENSIASGIDSGVKITRKYGSETGLVNDEAVVFAKNPYILVVMAKGQDESQIKAVIPDISRIVYNAEK